MALTDWGMEVPRRADLLSLRSRCEASHTLPRGPRLLRIYTQRAFRRSMWSRDQWVAGRQGGWEPRRQGDHG